MTDEKLPGDVTRAKAEKCEFQDSKTNVEGERFPIRETSSKLVDSVVIWLVGLLPLN